MNLNEIPAEAAKKIPNLEQYRSNPTSAITYVFMVLFLLYFGYKEFKGDAIWTERIADLEKLNADKDVTIKNLNNRVTKLENTIDVYRGAIQKVEDAATIETGGTN